MYIYIYIYIHTYIHIPTYLHIYIPAYLHTCMHACIHAYMHTCIHAYMHVHIHVIHSIHIHVIPIHIHTHMLYYDIICVGIVPIMLRRGNPNLVSHEAGRRQTWVATRPSSLAPSGSLQGGRAQSFRHWPARRFGCMCSMQCTQYYVIYGRGRGRQEADPCISACKETDRRSDRQAETDRDRQREREKETRSRETLKTDRHMKQTDGRKNRESGIR